ncbi:MAG: Tad domain-containing protein [Pseudomonadota bacterium]
MLKRKLTPKLSNFVRENKGGAAIAFAIALPMVVGFSAFATDIGNAYLQEERLQNLTESVALAALVSVRENVNYGAFGKADALKTDLVKFAKKTMSNDAITAADIEFGQWDFATKTFLALDSNRGVTAVRVKGYRNADRGNEISSILGGMFHDKYDISASAIAVMPIPPDIHVLSENASPAFVMDESDIDTKTVVVNSKDSSAVSLTGSGSGLGMWYIDVAGGYTGSPQSRSRADKRVNGKTPGLGDFLQYQPMPKLAGCRYRNYVPLAFAGTIYLNPGTYCGGLRLTNPAARVIFRPGVYIIEGGPLEITNKPHVFGDGVFIFMTGKNSGLRLTNSDVRLKAPMSGKWAGLVMMSDRRDAYAPEDNLLNDTRFVTVGTLYFPKSSFEITDGSFNFSCRWLCLVADTVVTRSIFINGYSGYHLPSGRFPGSSVVPAPPGLEVSFRPYLVEKPNTGSSPAPTN